jgi:anti-sigma B factor antagonist
MRVLTGTGGPENFRFKRSEVRSRRLRWAEIRPIEGGPFEPNSFLFGEARNSRLATKRNKGHTAPISLHRLILVYRRPHVLRSLSERLFRAFDRHKWDEESLDPAKRCRFGKVIASNGNLWQNSSHATRGVVYMAISIRQIDNTTVVDVVGDITLHNTPEVRKVLLDLIREKRASRVVMNLSAAKYIDSAGVASLVEGLKMSREMKSGFALFGLSRTAREVLELTRLIKVFEVYNTEEEAVLGRAAASAS